MGIGTRPLTGIATRIGSMIVVGAVTEDYVPSATKTFVADSTRSMVAANP